MRRKISSFFGLVLVIVVGVGMLTACSGTSNSYYTNLSKASFWNNKGNESIAQNHFYDIMNDFYKDGADKITVDENGNVVGKDGKVKKVAFIGFDGVRADAMYNILSDANKTGDNGDNYTANFSGIALAKSTGGLYHAYAGGEKDKASEQDTSTSPGWISELTGKLHTEHGVHENDEIMKNEVQTIMTELAALGLNSSISFGWSTFFDVNLNNEIKYLLANPKIAEKIQYRSIDRKVAANEAEMRAALGIDNDDKYAAGSFEAYNFVANPQYVENQLSDIAIRDYFISRVEAGDDFVSGLFSNPDGAGHTTGFSNNNPAYVNSVRNSDNYTYEMMKAIEERQAANNEDWLILITTDHGGKNKSHGEQYLECKNIWLACNKTLDSKYFRENFDGFRENA